MTLGRLFSAALFLIAPSVALAAPRSAPPGQCRTVHGRMALANGSFSFRIWVVGTHRMLRVVDSEGHNFSELEKLPSSLGHSLQPYSDDLFRPRVFADFTICAFTKSEPGVMQSVTLTAAKNIRIDPD